MTYVQFPIALIITFLWIGFVSAISFMEAWLKFRAPGVTLAIGLSIGRLVFNSLNKIEWVLAVALICILFYGRMEFFNWQMVLLYIPILMLIVQTIWILPTLDARAELHINGLIVPKSNMHLYYVIVEVIKVCCLIAFGILLL